MGAYVTFPEIDLETIKKQHHTLKGIRVHCTKQLIELCLTHVNLSSRHYHLEYLDARASPAVWKVLFPDHILNLLKPSSDGDSQVLRLRIRLYAIVPPEGEEGPHEMRHDLQKFRRKYTEKQARKQEVRMRRLRRKEDLRAQRLRQKAMTQGAAVQQKSRRESWLKGLSRETPALDADLKCDPLGAEACVEVPKARKRGKRRDRSASEPSPSIDGPDGPVAPEKMIEKDPKKGRAMGAPTSPDDESDSPPSPPPKDGLKDSRFKRKTSPSSPKTKPRRKKESILKRMFTSKSRPDALMDFLKTDLSRGLSSPSMSGEDTMEALRGSKVYASSDDEEGDGEVGGEGDVDVEEGEGEHARLSGDDESNTPTYAKALPQVTSQNVTLVYANRHSRLPTVLGNGTYGIVYLGQYMNRKVAVKVLQLDDPPDEDLAAVKKEVDIMMQNEHHNILKCYGMFTEKNDATGTLQAYIVLELATGGDLYDALHSRNGLLKNATNDELLQVMIDLCLGVQYLHRRGIIHRDLKSNNILLSWNAWKLCDFGSSKLSKSLRGQTIHGTPEYLAPEILNVFERKVVEYTYLVDIYSLGVLFWEIWTRRKVLAPYYEKYGAQIARDPMKFVSFLHRNAVRPPLSAKYMRGDCPEDLKALISRCWAKEPKDRPQTVDEILVGLNRIAAGSVPSNIKTIYFEEDQKRVYYVGEFTTGEKHGVGKEYYVAGEQQLPDSPPPSEDKPKPRERQRGHLKYEGDFFYDEFQKGKYYDRELGHLMYDGEFFNERFHGIGKEFDLRGAMIYEGDWKNGRRDGDGKEYYSVEIGPRALGGERVVEVHVKEGEEETDDLIEVPIEVEGESAPPAAAAAVAASSSDSNQVLRFDGRFKKGRYSKGRYYSRGGDVLFDGEFRFRSEKFLFKGFRLDVKRGALIECVEFTEIALL